MNHSSIARSDAKLVVLRYGAAVVAVFIGFGVRVALERTFGGSLPTYITFYPVVMLVALLAGFWPGMLATLVTVLLVDFWVLAPHGLFQFSAHPIDAIGQLLFAGMGTLMSAAADLYHGSRQRAADLEQKFLLRESQERLRLALDAAKAGSWTWDMVSGAIEWSPELFRLFGLDPASAKASFDHWQSVILPEDRPVAQGRLEQAIQKREHLSSEYRIVLPTGEVRWINALGDTTYDTAGKPVRMSGICLDITERKRAEDALREGRSDLNRAQAVAHMGSWRLNVRSNELLWSEEAWRIFGMPQGTPLTYETFLSTIHPDDRATVDEKWAAALRGEPYDIEHRIVVDGKIKWVRELAQLEFDEKGQLLGGFGTTQDITGKRQTEEALRASEARYRSYLEVTDQVGWTTDADGLVVEDMPAWRRFTGQSLEDIQVWGWAKALHPDDLKRTSEVWQKAVREKRNYETEYRMRRHDGIYRNFLARGVPTFNEDGSIREWVGTCIDITERKEAQIREQEALAVAAAEQTAMDTLEAMGEGVMLLDMQGRIMSVNPALEKIGGYSESEVKGRTLAELLATTVADEDRQLVFDELALMLRGELTALKPVTLVAKDGRRIPVIPAASFIRSAEGKPTMIVVTVRDISELRRTYQALEESERKYRELVENASSIIMRLTPEHAITFFNEHAQAFFGFSESEVLGRNVIGTIVPRVDSDGRNMKDLMRAISEMPDAFVNNENENICKDGRRVWVHWTNRAVRDAHGNLREILCVGVDVTQRKRLEMEQERYQQRLRELGERLASTEERERHRISTQIHDTVIQTLSLSNIKLGSVRKGLGEAGFAGRAEEVNNARALIEEAIKESRSLMAELTPPLLYELGLAPALQDLSQRLEKQHRIPIRVQDDGRGKPIDKLIHGTLFEAARELIMNALKHAGPCTITVSLSRDDNHLRICVEDTGVGFTAPADGRFVLHKGGGFGLFSIRERLDRIGGNLDIGSQPGKGTTATIRVPLKSAP